MGLILKILRVESYVVYVKYILAFMILKMENKHKKKVVLQND